MNYPKMLRFFGGFVALALLLVIGSPLLRAQAADSEEISKLFSDARSHALLAEYDAELLESYTRSSASWQTYAFSLRSMADHVNDLGKVQKQLTDLRSQGSPWQQEAIDRINPLLRNMADQLTATIKHLNDHQSQVHMQPYRDLTEADYDLASRTASFISDIVEYDKAKSRASNIEHELELPAAGDSK